MKRINEIAKLIHPYEKIADVGCDHGRLIIEAFKNVNIVSAIAIDNKSGPLKQAIWNLEMTPYFEKVRFSLSSGIQDINYDTEVVIVAGMGGMMIVEILKDDLKNVRRIITQANRDNYKVRKHIVSLGFIICEEVVVYENGKYYEIISFERSPKEICYTTIEYIYGPILMSTRNNIFLQMLKEKLERLLCIETKTQIVIQQIKEIEKILGDKNEN